jgi:protein TonB
MVEENAQFPGGDAECFKWLSEHIKYPSICVEQGVQGRVIVNFVVNRDGSIVDVKTVRSPDPNLTKEAERVVKLMPKWKPARQGNKTVRSRFTLPVMFRLS